MDKEYRERTRGEEHEAVPRKVYISKDDLETHGYTVGCPGCKSVLRGTTRQAHTESCRNRVEEGLEVDGEGDESNEESGGVCGQDGGRRRGEEREERCQEEDEERCG